MAASTVAEAGGITPPRMIALVPAGFSFVLYAITSSPTVNFTDSGELIAVAWTGGIAHPPGYPLYTLLNSLFVHLPFGDPAWRMNILSALFGAVAVGFFYLLVADTLSGMPAFQRAMARRSPRSGGSVAPKPGTARKSERPTPSPTQNSRLKTQSYPEGAPAVIWIAAAGGLAAAGLLAVSLTFWNWATQAKFYTLHYAFVAALFWLALRARRALVAEIAAGTASAPRRAFRAWPPGVRLLHLLVFVAGLSLTNHFLTFLALPGIAILMLSPIRYAKAVLGLVWRHAVTLAIAAIVPLLLYLYLPLRASMDPLIEWGSPDTWSNFWRQVTAQSYQGYFGGADLGNHLADALIYAANQFGLWLGLLLLALTIAGLVYLWREDRGLLTATGTAATINLLVVLNYNIREIATYYVPLYMIALWWAGLGIAQGIRLLFSRMLAPEQAGTLSRNPAAVLALGAILPLIALVVNCGAAGHRDNYTAELFARNAFKNVRPNALVLTNYWDLTSLTFYMRHVLNERPDLVLIDKSLFRQPFYLDYLERNHPEVISRVAGPFGEYKTLVREWVATGRTPPGLQEAYLNVLNGLIDDNLGERPVYAYFIVDAGDAQETQEVLALLEARQSQLVPDGIGYRIAAGLDDLRARDPQFDLRGLTDRKVPLDEIEASVVAIYSPVLQNIGAYLQKSDSPEDQAQAAGVLGLVQELAPFAARQDARPRLR